MIELIDIESCFNITHLPQNWERFMPDDGSAYDSHVFEPLTYKCICGYMIEFTDVDFKKHRLSNFSNLTPKDDDVFNKYIKQNNLKVNSFLDFYCPKCGKATRIFFSSGYGGRHGDYIVDIELALAVKK